MLLACRLQILSHLIPYIRNTPIAFMPQAEYLTEVRGKSVTVNYPYKILQILGREPGPLGIAGSTLTIVDTCLKSGDKALAAAKARDKVAN